MCSIKRSGKTLKFDNIEVNKKEFHASKEAIALNLLDTSKIVISDKFKYSDNGFKYFIGYKNDNIVPLLCLILLKMSGYIEYFENGGKSMSFMIKDTSVLVKYNEIWNKIKKALNSKFYTMLVYDEKYLKAKVGEYYGLVKTNFCDEKTPKEGVHHTCIACMSIDSLIRIEKKKKISTSLFRRMQVWNKEDEDAWIYRR